MTISLMVLFVFLFLIKSVLIPFVIGFILAYILEPFVEILENIKIPKNIAIILTYFVFVGIIVLFIFYAVPNLIRDLNRLIELIPEYAQYMQKTIWEIQDNYSRISIPESIRQVIDDTIAKVEQITLGVIQGLVQSLIGLVGQGFNFIIAPIISYYFLKDFNKIGKYILKIMPVRYRDEFLLVAKEIDCVLRKFLKGSIIVAFLVGLMTTAGMYLVGMDFPALIGIMVGVTNIIPYFGAIISSVPVVLLALSKSKWLGIYVLGIMLLVQQIEGNIISPKILGSSVGLHPLMIIFVLLTSGYLWGFVGLLIAVPLAAILKVIFKHLYLRVI